MHHRIRSKLIVYYHKESSNTFPDELLRLLNSLNVWITYR